MEQIQTIRGRTITEKDIAGIKELIKQNPERNRTWISRELCRKWKWVQPNGNLKEVGCRDLLLRLERRGFIQLPTREHDNKKKRFDKDENSEMLQTTLFKEESIDGKLGEYGKAELKLMHNQLEQNFWNRLIHKYHYLGYHCTVGASLKYLIYLSGDLVGCIGFASAVLKLSLRDEYIGWDFKTREKNLKSIVNNNRFLILPWVKVQYLASHVLSISAKRVKGDWKRIYNTPVYLLETFVDKELFRGTCYKAANWVYLGETKGKGRSGLKYYVHGRVKDVYVYPLAADFRKRLTGVIE